MSGRRSKTWTSVAAMAALTASMAIGSVGRSSVQAAPGDDAFDVPGIGALQLGDDAAVEAISCPSAGNCWAAGFYEDAEGGRQGFMVPQVDGVWGDAVPIPGLAALNEDGSMSVLGLSCATADDCSAVGFYDDGAGDRQGFVVSQVDGVWADALPVPGLASLNTEGYALVWDVSCGAPGDCVAGGGYDSTTEGEPGFIVEQVDGVWGTVSEVPGLAELNVDKYAEVTQVACSSAGDCTVAGFYSDEEGDRQGFVASRVDGVWGDAEPIPGLAALNESGSLDVNSLSCASTGNCAVVGRVGTATGSVAFVASQGDGVWGSATIVPGLAALDVGEDAELQSVSCSAPGYCSAGGSYYGASLTVEGFVVSQVAGEWGTAVAVPGLEALSTGGSSSVDEVECVSSGNCVATGYFDAVDLGDFAFYAVQTGGVWSDAIRIPGLPTMPADENDADMHSISCTSAGICVGGGDYRYEYDPDVHQAFLYEFPLVSGGSLQPLLPARLVESRPGEETVDHEFEGFDRVAAGSVTRFDVAGRGGVPEGADAAMLNVTAVLPSAPGYLTVWSCEGDVPVASSVNYSAGVVAPNAVLTALNGDGEACIYSLSATDLVVDVNGYVPVGGSPAALLPARLVESRPFLETVDHEFEAFGQVEAGSITRFDVAGRGGVSEGAEAVMLNVTAVFPEAQGFLTVWSCDGDVPVASSVNYSAGDVAPNAVLTALNDDGEACIYSLAATDLVVDVNGAVDAGHQPTSVLPARLVESRPGDDTIDGDSEGFGQVAAGSTTRFVVAGRGGVPDGAQSALLNVTAVFPEAPGFLTVWSCDGDVPVASSVNYFAGGVYPNAVLTELNDTGEACIYSLAATDLIADVNAYTD